MPNPLLLVIYTPVVSLTGPKCSDRKIPGRCPQKKLFNPKVRSDPDTIDLGKNPNPRIEVGQIQEANTQGM